MICCIALTLRSKSLSTPRSYLSERGRSATSALNKNMPIFNNKYHSTQAVEIMEFMMDNSVIRKNQTFCVSILIINLIYKYKLQHFLEKKFFDNFQNGRFKKFQIFDSFGFEHHHFGIFLKYFVPEFFEIILYIHFSLLELGQFTQFL